METNNELTTLRTEVAEMRVEIRTLISEMESREKRLAREREKEKEKAPTMPNRPKVSKVEAASILLMSPRNLQRIRKKVGLKWIKSGRETHYFLETIVAAIHAYQLAWSQKAFDSVRSRITKLPVL